MIVPWFVTIILSTLNVTHLNEGFIRGDIQKLPDWVEICSSFRY